MAPLPHTTYEDYGDDGDDDEDEEDEDQPITLKTRTSPRKGGKNGDCVCNTKLNAAA